MRSGSVLVCAACLLAAGWARASEPAPVARASFPALSSSESAAPARESSLDRLSPKVVGALPPLAPVAQPPPYIPAPAAAPRTAPPSPTTEWEVTRVLRRPSARQPYDTAPPERLTKDRDRWMLSIEGATRAPIDAGVQGSFETPVGLRLFGAYGQVPSMYLGRITGTAAAVSADPVLSALIEDGVQRGQSSRVGLGWRPFSRLGVYLDAGYARLRLQGELDSSLVAGSHAIDSRLDLGFAELGYQAKVAERLVLAAALGVTKVLRAETRATPAAGGASDPRLDAATSLVDEGLETYGYLPTLTLRLGLDLI